MRLLIITQAVDRTDPLLGFFHRWVEEFAGRVDSVVVVCLREGDHHLPENVSVYSLGKEEGVSRCAYLVRFYTYIWGHRSEYDAVFVHMNQLYVLLGGLIWWLLQKRVVLWYAHGHVSLSLRVATLFVRRVVTSTESGFRLKSEKKVVVGQGIDTKRFHLCAKSYESGQLRLISVGRISPIKHYETLIRAVAELALRGVDVTAGIVGGVGAPGQETYVAELEKLAGDLKLEGRVTFLGALSNTEISVHLCGAHLFINPSQTGSLDKAGLEAMASGLPVFTCNEAFTEVLGAYGDRLMFPNGEYKTLATQILAFIESSDRAEVARALSERVAREHSVTELIPRILRRYE